MFIEDKMINSMILSTCIYTILTENAHIIYTDLVRGLSPPPLPHAVRPLHQEAYWSWTRQGASKCLVCYKCWALLWYPSSYVFLQLWKTVQDLHSWVCLEPVPHYTAVWMGLLSCNSLAVNRAGVGMAQPDGWRILLGFSFTSHR